MLWRPKGCPAGLGVVQDCAKQPGALAEYLGVPPIQGVTQCKHHVTGSHGAGSALAGARFPVVAAIQQEDLGDIAPRNQLPYTLRYTHAMMNMTP